MHPVCRLLSNNGHKMEKIQRLTNIIKSADQFFQWIEVPVSKSVIMCEKS